MAFTSLAWVQLLQMAGFRRGSCHQASRCKQDLALQGIKRECKALPLTVRQMLVQQVQLEAIKRREAVGLASPSYICSILHFAAVKCSIQCCL